MRATVSKGFFVKLALIAIVNALGVYALMAAWQQEAMGIFIPMLIGLIVIDYVYFSRRAIAAKYLVPGIIFLLVYQVFVIGYTGFVAFTNYGDGHNSTKDDAIAALLIQNEHRVEDSPSYPLTVVADGDELGFAVVIEDAVHVGTAEEPLQVAEGVEMADGEIAAIADYRILDRSEILENQSEIVSLRVPVSEDEEAGSIRSQDARTGYIYTSSLEYDEETDTMTNIVTGVEYQPNDHGQFQAEDGSKLPVGWRVSVGFENFLKGFTDSRYSGPFLQVLIWTFVFAFLSVATTFLLGMFFAIALNHPRVRGRRIYRSLLILPYAIPSFLAFLLWSGLLNRRFGFMNNVFFGGAEIPWLTDPWLAKLSIILVNLWVGFPYMFLICTGALQSIPGDVMESARLDGAGPIRIWRSITMPLLMISVAPLLISSFAFNFNNFNLVYMLTNGGPPIHGAPVPIGQTDILISMVYSVSGLDGSGMKQYGLASALSIVIFAVVAIVSIISFRRTRSLEDVM